MAGVLSFTLGLETSNFLRGVGLASGQIISLSAIMDGLSKVAAGVWAAMERGGALADLSARTGESVHNLYLLQEAFKGAGLGADSVGPMVMRLQKAMSGFDESGNKTTALFEKLGLDLDTLRGMDAPAQLQAIAQALAGLDRNQATDIASKIFGREGAGNFLQIARDLEGFKQSLKDFGPAAEVVARTARVFKEIGDAITKVKGMVGGMFTGIAEGVAPVLKQVVDLIGQIDFVGIGERIGYAFQFAIQVVKDGRIYEFLTASFEASIEFFGTALFNLLGNGSLWTGIWEVSIGAFEARLAAVGKILVGLGTVLKAALSAAFQTVFEWIGKIPKLGAFLGLDGTTADSFSQIYAKERANAAPGQEILDQLFNRGKENLFAGANAIKQAITDAMANSGGPAQERLRKLIQDISAAMPQYTPEGQDKTAPVQTLEADQKARKPADATAWEKIGFVLSNGRTDASLEYARKTADNTYLTVKRMDDLIKLLPNVGVEKPNFANS